MALDFLKFTDENSIRVASPDIEKQVSAILRAVGTPDDDAEVTARILTKASLMAVDSHGVGNVVRYSQSIQSGEYTVPQDVEVVSESDTTALLDCGNGLGFVAAHRAMEMSIAKAKEHGVGMATVRAGHHIGMVGYYPLMAIEEGMIGMATTNASPAARPALGAAPRLGTNPIAFGAPTATEKPFLLDMATTTVAAGKLGLARRLGVPVPVGWAVTAEGQPLTEPPAQRGDHWMQNPLGNTREQGSHKGYGLAVMVDILCGVLSGGGFGAQLKSGENMTWTMAVDVSKFRPLDEFTAMMDDMVQTLHATPAEPGEKAVLVAGDPEWEAEAERLEKGIPLHETQYDEIRKRAQELDVELFI